MRKNEITVGNLVTVKTAIYQVTGITMHGEVYLKKKDGIGTVYDIKDLKGLKFTGPRLRACGFDNDIKENLYTRENLSVLDRLGDGSDWCLFINNLETEDCGSVDHIKEIHQLQNIFFLLKNRELPIVANIF